ncbi:MAG TPA: serine/threonine-protein kinase, partial [Sandaracinaceae bacterium LLY-WYZ-13_1]|nr:serine/threonine-protein kinase [Sandaracinaceae bacterium LLY-WYZ-13_1]
MGHEGDSEDGSLHPPVAGRYRLLERIGEGGMAEVWRARDVRLARDVAVKLLTLHGEHETEDDRARRFLREARIAAAVRHAHVVDVLDFGRTDDGQPFMVMELLRGESLEQRLSRTPPLTLSELLEIALAVLDGLEAVHRAGIVHRDLKPDNVFLLEESGRVRPKLIDFGVSRATDGTQGRRSVLTTMQGRLVGTPEYMSPEQARGHADVDERTDLYSVGVVLYEAITGRLPYDAEGLGDLIIAIAMGGAPPVVLVQPDAGEAISAVVDRAMRVARDERWPSARAMRDALAEAMEQSLGRDARGSLPAPSLARHAASPDRVPSEVVTVEGGPVARAVNGTPEAFVVDGHPPSPSGRRWVPALAAAGLGLVLAAGLGAWALTGASAPEAPLPPAASATLRADRPEPARDDGASSAAEGSTSTPGPAGTAGGGSGGGPSAS